MGIDGEIGRWGDGEMGRKRKYYGEIATSYENSV
jgi:hypothetical protein